MSMLSQLARTMRGVSVNAAAAFQEGNFALSSDLK